jgi:hypothetical protein
MQKILYPSRSESTSLLLTSLLLCQKTANIVIVFLSRLSEWKTPRSKLTNFNKLLSFFTPFLVTLSFFSWPVYRLLLILLSVYSRGGLRQPVPVRPLQPQSRPPQPQPNRFQVGKHQQCGRSYHKRNSRTGTGCSVLLWVRNDCLRIRRGH